MLNTFPLALNPPSGTGILPSRVASRRRGRASSPPRRRGGQPSNRNALNHGLYAAKNPTPLTSISSSLPAYPRGLAGNPASLSQQIIHNLIQDIAVAYQNLRSADNHRAMLAWFNTLVRMVSLVGRLKLDYIRQYGFGSDLQVAAQHAPGLIHFSFLEQGITPTGGSFRDNTCKSDFNSVALAEERCHSGSRAPIPFLTPRQCAVLLPLLPPVERTGKRGRPPANPRILLDAIFWKLAHHARWQDLPPCYPSMHTCRRYYRRLLLEGRLDALYTALYKDFVTRGKVSLPVLLKQGNFAMFKKKVVLPRRFENFWQMRTALLFLQQGCLALRRAEREKALEYRRQHPTLLMLARKKEQQIREWEQEDVVSYIPIDLGNLGPTWDDEDEPPTSPAKKPAHPHSPYNKPLHPYPRREREKITYIPIDLGNLGPTWDDEDEPPGLPGKKPLSPKIRQKKKKAPPLNSSHSPPVPNTQSHSGELTP